MLIRYGYEMELCFPQPTSLVCLLTRADPRSGELSAVEKFSVQPQLTSRIYDDVYGNHCRRIDAPTGALTLRSDATIQVDGLIDPADWSAEEVPVHALPDDTLLYLLGSRYCQTDLLSQFAWDRFGAVSPGWSRVQAICDYVHNHISFDYMQASSTRGADEVWKGKVGVCRDYAHLAITLLRCMNIPARYVNGYLGDIGVPVVDPMDFSAWIEVFLGGRWFTFDPRNNMPRMGRIVVARGRDAADVPLVQSFGQHTLNGFKVWTYEVLGNSSSDRGKAQHAFLVS